MGIISVYFDMDLHCLHIFRVQDRVGFLGIVMIVSNTTEKSLIRYPTTEFVEINQ